MVATIAHHPHAIMLNCTSNSACLFHSSFLLGTKLNGIKLEVQDENEPIENTIKRFKRAVNQSGHLMEMRHRELWETAADKRKRKQERARQLQRIERTNDRYERQGQSEYNS